MRGRVVFRVVVGKILGALAPMDEEMALADTIAYPIEAHIHGFGAALFDGVIYDTCCTGIVRLNRRWRLRMAQIGQRGQCLRVGQRG